MRGISGANAPAFWISPEGEVIRLTTGYHIHNILNEPETFGLTRDDVDKTHERYGEDVGTEGKARDELMIKVLRRGWQRIRGRRNAVSIQVWVLDQNTSVHLEDFVRQGTEDGVQGIRIGINEEFRIHELSSETLRRPTAKQIIRGHLFEAKCWTGSYHDLASDVAVTLKEYVEQNR